MACNPAGHRDLDSGVPKCPRDRERVPAAPGERLAVRLMARGGRPAVRKSVRRDLAFAGASDRGPGTKV